MKIEIQILVLCAIIFGSAIQQVFKKAYNNRGGNSIYIFCGLTVLAAAIFFVASADYPCDFDHEYTLEEIAAFPLILLDRKASSRLYLEKFFLQNGLHLDPEIELGSRSLLVDLAGIGFGVSGVTKEFVHKELQRGELRELKTAFSIPPRSVDLCVLRDVPMTAAAQRFCDYVKESLKN